MNIDNIILTIFSFLPIVLLVFFMTKKKSMPSSKALPLSALILYFIMLIVFKQDANLVHANVIKGLLVAWTPILIIAGAIFLFRTMEATGSLSVIRQWLNTVSKNKIAQLMIVGWAFPFLIEGASGFGTPAAIAAPILVGLGFPPVRVAILALIMNSVPVSFGAVGTPTWFGFSAIDLTAQETLIIGFKSAIMNGIAALVIPAIALMFVVKPKSVRKNWLFILLSVLVTVIPYIIVAKYNYEFPSLVGGTIGLILTALLARFGVGLSKSEVELQEQVGKSNLVHTEETPEAQENLSAKELIKATFPLWGTLLLLVITRIPQLGIKALLSATEPAFNLSLGSIGDFSLSAALVVSLKGIFGTGINWAHQVLYVPSILPFVVISLITFLIYRSKRKAATGVLNETVTQMVNPTRALLGALVFVNLMMMGGESSAVANIGQTLADLTGDSWKYFASFLGAIGSFFSGSNTISNLTFGGIQDSIATALSLDRTTILAMQSVGGAMGNMVCINNIVAVASVLALGNIEGYILKRTVRAMLVYGAIVAIIAIFI
jgi:lactate permease